MDTYGESLGKKVYLVGPTTSTQEQPTRIIKEQIEAAGGEVVGEVIFPSANTEVAPIIAKIKEVSLRRASS